MTGPSLIELCSPCPVCGGDASWRGRRVPGDGTAYEVVCDRCLAVTARPWIVSEGARRLWDRVTGGAG